jgi:hypothetical protein
MSQPRPAFLDALPDLIIGLIGIPVAVSAQRVAETALGFANEPQRLIEGLVYFALILVLYGLASIGMLMVFEVEYVAIRPAEDDKDDRGWQARLVATLGYMTPFAFLFTISLIAAGISYSKEGPEFFKKSLFLSPAALLVASVFMNMGLTALALKPRGRVFERFQVAHPFWAVVQFAAFVVAAAMFVSTL